MRVCAKMRCSHEPVATVSLIYTERMVVVDDLFDEVNAFVGYKLTIDLPGAHRAHDAARGLGRPGPSDDPRRGLSRRRP